MLKSEKFRGDKGMETIKNPLVAGWYADPEARSVSYTHLDVYKRQDQVFVSDGIVLTPQ